MLAVFLDMRQRLRVFTARANVHGPKFRDGTARATWLVDSVQWEFESIIDWLTLDWLLSDATKLTISEADFSVGVDELTAFGILGATDFPTWIANMEERDRDKLVDFFQADVKDAGLNVQQKLGQLRTLITTAQATAMALINTTGDATTIGYETVGGLKRASGKTFTDMGINGVPLADEIDLIAAKVGEVIRVV